MPLKFQETQKAFAAHIRNPTHGVNDIEPRRMKIYEDLFFKNIEGFASSTFPVFRSLFSESQWLALVREFMIEHRAQTPYFLEISQEFLAFIQSYQGAIQLPLFSAELMHYEWVELALDVAEEEVDWAEVDPNADLLTHPVVVSPVAWPLSYQFPVQEISAEFQPTAPSASPHCLLVHRDRSLKVRFNQINPPIYVLLNLLLQNSDKTGHENLLLLGQQMGFEDEATLLEFGRELLENLQRDGIVLGAKR